MMDEMKRKVHILSILCQKKKMFMETYSKKKLYNSRYFTLYLYWPISVRKVFFISKLLQC